MSFLGKLTAFGPGFSGGGWASGEDPGKKQLAQVLALYKQGQGQLAGAQANALQYQKKALGAIQTGYKGALANAGNTAYAGKQEILGRETQNLGAVRANLENSGLGDTTLGANLNRAVYRDTNTSLGQIDSALSAFTSNLLAQKAQLESGVYGDTASMFGSFGAQNANLSGQIAQTVAGVQHTDPNAWLSSLFQAGTTAAIAASDRRLKENIVHIAGLEYEFSYKGQPGRYRGVMADEVPWAAHEIDGYMHVDYSRVPVRFRRVA